MKNKEITVLDQEIHINKDDYFSLTDIARYKNAEEPRFVTELDAQDRYNSIYRVVGAIE